MNLEYRPLHDHLLSLGFQPALSTGHYPLSLDEPRATEMLKGEGGDVGYFLEGEGREAVCESQGQKYFLLETRRVEIGEVVHFCHPHTGGFLDLLGALGYALDGPVRGGVAIFIPINRRMGFRTLTFPLRREKRAAGADAENWVHVGDALRALERARFFQSLDPPAPDPEAD